MLTINLIQKTKDFFEHILENLGNEALIVVTPNPGVADLVRSRFDSMGKEVHAITISKFIKEELNKYFEEDELAGFRGKSELILILGAIWKKLGQEQSYVAFQRAFTLLTEFRSFSISDQVLETVLENYDESISHQVLWQQRFIQELDLIDEHRSYYMLSERLREGNLGPEEVPRNICFYGFDYLTALQVDLLKALAMRDHLYIPFYKKAYDKASGLDWIKWFQEHESEIVESEQSQDKDYKVDTISYSKNYLGKTLKNITEDHSDFDIMLGTKNLTREYLQDIPLKDIRYKVPVDLFSSDFNTVLSYIEGLVGDNVISTEELKEKLKERANLLIQAEQFRELKVISIFMNKIIEWESLSSGNDEITDFDVQILKESAALDLPRINFTSLNANALRDVKAIADLEKIKNRKVYFCLNSNYGPMLGGGATHSENVEKYLASIGPMRRKELELEVLSAKLEEFISDNDVVLVTEKLLIKHDTTLNKLFSNIKRVDIEFENSSHLDKEYLDIEKQVPEVKRISASKLQKYIECPRKYYHQYISKFSPEIELEGKLSPLELGRIEHKIIEDFFKKNLIYDETVLDKLVMEVLSPYLREKKIEMEQEYIVEIKSYTFSCIEWLINLKQNFPEMKMQFEYPFSIENSNEHGVDVIGFIDLFAEIDGVTILIDFKRSNSIFKTFTAIEEFEQIQLWFYLTKLMDTQAIKTSDIITGYVNLSDLSTSKFFASSKELLKEYKGFLSPASVQAFANFDESVENYRELESNAINELKKQKDFLPVPRDKDVCKFCSINSICSRGINGNT